MSGLFTLDWYTVITTNTCSQVIQTWL